MRDNDDLHDIPPMVPPRDDVAQRQQSRRSPDIVKSVRYGEIIKVSTWPVRFMLALLSLALMGGAAAGYLFYQQYQLDLSQSQRRIQDLEGRLALVGDSAEETTANVLERLDFNFSEIDKLWAARNQTNQNVTDLTGRVSMTENGLRQVGTDVESANQLIVTNTNLIEEARSQLGDFMRDSRASDQQMSQAIARLNATVENLQTVAQEMVNLRATLVTTQGVSGGIDERLANVEEAIEAIDAFRLQINQALLRLQENIEAVEARL
ncbi:MAG: hypothetical protein RQ757_03240 [Pseudomonadales bacterium]|nr:hypothetical protein [Pseudomonadales bacterium]